MSTLKPTAIVLATTILAFANGGSASAAPIPSSVTITRATFDPDGGVNVRGKVTSPAPACLKRRRVDVYHDVPPLGEPVGPEDFFLGQAVTNDEGRWRLSTEFNPDKVIAKVLRKERPGRDCGADTSPTKTVKAP